MSDHLENPLQKISCDKAYLFEVAYLLLSLLAQQTSSDPCIFSIWRGNPAQRISSGHSCGGSWTLSCFLCMNVEPDLTHHLSLDESIQKISCFASP